MNLQKQQRLIIDALEDTKAQDIKVFNTMELTSLFDRVIIASGTSNRQTRAIAHHVADRARQGGLSVLAFEGEDTGEWVLVDLGDIIVHVMLPATRAYYNLEQLWGAAEERRSAKSGSASAPPA